VTLYFFALKPRLALTLTFSQSLQTNLRITLSDTNVITTKRPEAFDLRTFSLYGN